MRRPSRNAFEWLYTLAAIVAAGGAIASVLLLLQYKPHFRRQTLDRAALATQGDPVRGGREIVAAGCGACHEIAGIAGARGRVGPPLTGFAQRAYIAGVVPNTADNLVQWIQNPQSIEPRTAMPNLGLDQQTARDIAAFLYANERQR